MRVWRGRALFCRLKTGNPKVEGQCQIVGYASSNGADQTDPAVF